MNFVIRLWLTGSGMRIAKDSGAVTTKPTIIIDKRDGLLIKEAIGVVCYQMVNPLYCLVGYQLSI